MKRIPFIFTTACALLTSACGSATSILPVFESPGRLHSAELPDTLTRSEKEMNEVLAAVGQKPAPTLLRVGHVLGAYREYAMVVDETGGRSHERMVDGRRWTRADHAVRLMKRSFHGYGLNSVELDVHVAPSGLTNIKPDEVVVVHNQPVWKTVDASPVARAFLSHNTLRSVLDAFLETRRSNAEVKLYIEVKAPKECEAFDKEPPAECRRIGTGVAKVMRTTPEDSRASLAFISFWPQMLRVVHDAIDAQGSNADVHDYVLIVGPSDPAAAFLVSLFGASKGKVPPFDDAKKKWLETTAWMDGVWASPRASKSVGSDVAKINRARQRTGTTCLRVGMSTYQGSAGSFESHLRRAWNVPENELPTCGIGGTKAPAVIESLIYDIDTK
ncbi:MAG: hypothetical protein IPM54_22570 [Polyangiaceae bacterium]|nr:hypothetical protein [Polyangiaceae bacterium]